MEGDDKSAVVGGAYWGLTASCRPSDRSQPKPLCTLALLPHWAVILLHAFRARGKCFL
ncbi:Os04g0497700 [Oryza sativa Japonica Group]|uniref:Os04g0497700 protein n=1 Tax=Oryza sativa subsp. japonica TaxID=39947 RepID=A0A0P0WC53_ORYSJ|nr:hypothetical protein EE612_024202 [Oryza sativa]BAS89902.1 Os04g0497700 [Oryza sativa Japonica Group]